MKNSVSVGFFRLLFALFTGLSILAPAAAQAPDTRTVSADEWRFQLTPYVWMTGLDGAIRPFRGAPTADVAKSFSDVLDNLDAAVFLTGTARKGRYVLQGDFSYASTSDAASLPLGLTAKAQVRQISSTLTAGYNWQAGSTSSIDLMAGARLWDIKATVQVPGLLTARSSTSFIDPIVAARWRYDFAPRWSALFYADAGGFGVGSDSTWQLFGSLNYRIKNDIHLSLGYRQLSVNYRRDGRKLDFNMHGPMIGATFRF